MAFPKPGDQWHHWQLAEEIDAAPSRVIYEGFVSGSLEPVTVAVFDQEKAPRAVERLTRLQRWSEQVDHPAIVKVRACVLDDDYFTVVTELIDGQTLAEICGGAPWLRRVEAALLAVEAVADAHELGVIHRDLKPSNIMIQCDYRGTRADGARPGLLRATLIDLELAQIELDTSSTVTLPGQPLGSAGFMSPEQARGDLRVITTRSDVYSLGATLYLCLTGHAPHGDGLGFAQYVGRVTGDHRVNDPRQNCSEIDEQLASVLMKSLEPEPAARYANAREMLEDLRRWQRGEPVLARPPRWHQAFRWWLRHHNALAAALSVSVLLLVGIAATTAVAVQQATFAAEQERIAQANEAKAIENEERAEELREFLQRSRAMVRHIRDQGRQNVTEGALFDGLAQIRLVDELIDSLADDPTADEVLASRPSIIADAVQAVYVDAHEDAAAFMEIRAVLERIESERKRRRQ
jgi:hypothetical protein